MNCGADSSSSAAFLANIHFINLGAEFLLIILSTSTPASVILRCCFENNQFKIIVVNFKLDNKSKTQDLSGQIYTNLTTFNNVIYNNVNRIFPISSNAYLYHIN